MNTKILNKAIEQYLTEFDSHWGDEKYKWAAVKCFELNWDIDSQHFDEMLERSLSKTENLLDSGNFFPCRTINSLAKLEPETVRKMFINLYDESLDLSTRINDFSVAAESLRAKYSDQIGKNNFQTTNSISVYLWLRYPDKYYLYKYTVYKQADKILRVGIWFKANGSPQEVINGYKFYDKLTKLLVANTDFVNCIRSHIDGNTSFYQDPKFHIATIDFGFWLSKYFKVDTSTIDNTHYWMYAPGDNASVWDDCKNDGIMCIGWHEMGDLSAYADRDSITAALQKTYNKPNSSCKNNALALWQFVHEIKPGDIVYAKKGTSQVVGRGIVEGDYEYNSKNTEYPNVRRVRWTHDGVWSLPNKAALKTLTDITNQYDCVSNLEDMIVNNAMVPKVDNNVRYWWLVANPKIWSIADLAVGGTQKYSLYGDKDKPRRIFQNFLEAKEGDIVIGYESTPNKKIVAFAEVSKGNDGKEIQFRKTEALRNPIEYSDLKEYDELSDMQFFAKGMQGSFFALTKDEFDCIEYIIRESNPLQKQVSTQAYTKADFLREVYISENRYDRLVKQLELKKNIILQGAPGVGKTFMAKRLAYSILGKKDDSYIEMVQFHQNYTYEDFIMGYKPTADGGFSLEYGKFYSMCKVAKANPNAKYFFIIDEINRGNLSKIFGELLMLIENSYRGEEMKLAYSSEMFCVPDNLYIIGMMNTADRSLAMIDYALRRRFSFFNMNPAFDSEGFKEYQKRLNSDVFNRFIEGIKQLNDDIANDNSLGLGFCIGHSYFCNCNNFDIDWLKNILEYDIEPMLKEYWFDDTQKYESQITLLRNILK